MQYGEILKLIRDKKNYSLEHVANEIGISTDELTEIEGQTQAPDIETLTKLADLYQVPLHSIEHHSIDHNINGNNRGGGRGSGSYGGDRNHRNSNGHNNHNNVTVLMKDLGTSGAINPLKKPWMPPFRTILTPFSTYSFYEFFW